MRNDFALINRISIGHAKPRAGTGYATRNLDGAHNTGRLNRPLPGGCYGAIISEGNFSFWTVHT